MTAPASPTGTMSTSTLDLVARFPGIVTADARPAFSGFIVEKDSLIEVATAIRDEFGFDLLTAVTGVDYFPENKMEVVYHAYKTIGSPMARRGFAGTRSLGFTRYQIHRSSRFAPHPHVGRL